MRILVDECVDERLRNFVVGHECQTVRYAGLAGLKNGELLARAEALKFEALLTVDQGLAYEQNLSGRKIAIVIFRTESNRLNDLLQHMPACLAVLKTIQPGQVIPIGSAG